MGRGACSLCSGNCPPVLCPRAIHRGHLGVRKRRRAHRLYPGIDQHHSIRESEYCAIHRAGQKVGQGHELRRASETRETDGCARGLEEAEDQLGGRGISERGSSPAYSRPRDDAGIHERNFAESWAVTRPGQTATSYWYDLSYDGALIDRFVLVSVDGGQARLPLPEPSTLEVDSLAFTIAQIFDEHDTLQEYMGRALLTNPKG